MYWQWLISVRATQLMSKAKVCHIRVMYFLRIKIHGMFVSKKVPSVCLIGPADNLFLEYDSIKTSEIMGQSFHILPTANDVTYKRMKMAARELEKLEQTVSNKDCEKLMRIIFCDQVQPSLPITNQDFNKLKIDVSHLNPAQQKGQG